MSLQVEKLEKNMAKLTVEVPAEEFEQALKTSYNKNKNRFNIPGFRRGKAPQAMVEKMYGVGVLYEDAADEAINNTYAQAMDELSLIHIFSVDFIWDRAGGLVSFVVHRFDY